MGSSVKSMASVGNDGGGEDRRRSACWTGPPPRSSGSSAVVPPERSSVSVSLSVFTSWTDSPFLDPLTVPEAGPRLCLHGGTGRRAQESRHASSGELTSRIDQAMASAAPIRGRAVESGSDRCLGLRKSERQAALLIPRRRRRQAAQRICPASSTPTWRTPPQATLLPGSSKRTGERRSRGSTGSRCCGLSHRYSW